MLVYVNVSEPDLHQRMTLIITDNNANVVFHLCFICSSWCEWQHLWSRTAQYLFPVSENGRHKWTVTVWGQWLLHTKNPIRIISVAGSLRTCHLSLSVHGLNPEIFPQRPGAPQRRHWWSTWWVLPSGLYSAWVNIPPHTAPVSFQEETLMFSSLNVIEEAEYTYYTTFQDNQYKVISSPAAIFRSLKLHQDLCKDDMHKCAPTCTFTESSLAPTGIHEATTTRHRVSAVSGKKLRGVCSFTDQF